MLIHGYELIEDWKNSTSGKIAKARKNGKEYFVKKYQTPVAPLDNGALDAKTYAHNKEVFEQFVKYRTKLNTRIRSVSGSGGNIIIPCDQFIEGNNYVEVSEFVEGAVPIIELEGVLASLSPDTKKLLMQTAAGAMVSIHKLGIVHSDLKPQNVMLVRKKNGNYVAKLIDFDSSYFVSEKPDEIIGTIDYYSPELGMYADAEDDRDTMSKNLTEKSDIFSLGLLFHLYLCGSLPTAINLTDRLKKRKEKGKKIYCWVALNSGCDIELSPSITNANYVSLIRDMLNPDPAERPTASEVLKRINESGPVIEEPWPEHTLMLDKKKLDCDGIIGLRKLIDKKQYELCRRNGKKEVVSKEDLISRKYAKIIMPEGFCKPWTEHNIEFDLDKIKKRGFVAGEQAEVAGVKGYTFYRSDSTSSFMSLDNLLLMKYARRITKPVAVKTEFGEPWPEHHIVFDNDRIKSRGFVGIKAVELNGLKGYSLTKMDGTSQFVPVSMMIMQKMAKKV